MKPRARLIPLLLALCLPSSGPAQLGFGDAGLTTSDMPEALTQPAPWLPGGYFHGASPGRQEFYRGAHPKATIDLPAAARPWSFDTFNGAHALLAFREAWSGGRAALRYDQSPLEKYDTVAASRKLGRDARSPGDDQVLAAVPGAALWEGNPVNAHNRAEVRAADGGRASIPVQQTEFLGDEDQVRVEGGAAASVVRYGGQEYPIMAVDTGRHGGQDYTYYVYHQDVSSEIARGAPLPEARFLATNEARSGGRVVKVKSWFTRAGRIGDHSDGRWGIVTLDHAFGSWSQSWNQSIQASYQGGSSGDSRVTLRWGPDLEHVVRDVTAKDEPFKRWESDEPGRRGRLATRDGEMEVEVTYHVDVYEYDAGLTLPGGTRGKNRLVLFPGKVMREALQRQVAQRAPGEDWHRYLPEGSGWIHEYWTQEEVEKGVSWSGHCAGFAAASVLFREPPARKTVSLATPVKKVRLKARHAAEAHVGNLQYETFGTPVSTLQLDNRDLKGIMTELGQAVHVDLEHPRRDDADRDTPGVKIDYPRNADGSRARLYSRGTEESWDDVLPHNLHIILLDFLVQRKRAVVMDRHPCSPVWNSPVYGYEFTVTGRENPKRYDVVAQIHYAGYGNSLAVGVKDQETRGSQPKQYPRDGVAPYEGDQVGQVIQGEALEFELLLDADNRVTESRWKGEEMDCEYAMRDAQGQVLRDSRGNVQKATRKVKVHPDFVWAPSGIVPPARDGNTSRINSNPMLDMAVLLDPQAPILGDATGGRVESYLYPWAQQLR